MATQVDNKTYDVVVLGDCVVDCINYVDRMPKIGETMAAKGFFCTSGGKGANACTASARLGSSSAFISKLGNDMFGTSFLSNLEKDKINVENVTFTDTSPTSVASIMVDNEGTNAIVVNFGATLELNEHDVDKAENLIKQSKVFVTTRMVKESTALYGLKVAKRHNLITVFNFAPANDDLNIEFNQYVDILVVNEVEAEAFTGAVVKTVEDAIRACNIVLAREGFHIGVVVTLGEIGAVFGNKTNGEIKHIKTRAVDKVVDTTGAGDAFVGSLAYFLSYLGIKSIDNSIELACEYASLSVQAKGTQASYPRLESLEPKFHIRK